MWHVKTTSQVPSNKPSSRISPTQRRASKRNKPLGADWRILEIIIKPFYQKLKIMLLALSLKMVTFH